MDKNISFYQLIFENAQEPIIILLDNIIKMCNQKALLLFGYPLENMVGKMLENFTCEHNNLNQFDKEKRSSFEWRFKNNKGECLFTEVSINSFEYELEKYDIVIFRNISRRVLTIEDSFKQLIENVKEAFWIQDFEQNKILYVSPMYEKIWGNTVDSLYKHPELMIGAVYKDDFNKVKKAYQRMREYNEDFREEFRIVRADGTLRWVWARNFPIINEKGQVYRTVGIAEDITERKALEEELLFCATKDGLTGINNRASFFAQVEAAIFKLSQLHQSCTIMMMDLDWYKNINDTFGHLAGDFVLKRFVEICNSQLRPNDIFGRIGGEEFAIFLPNTDVKIGLVVAERIRKSIEDFKFVDDKLHKPITVTVSIGVSPIYYNDNPLDNALLKADKSLYKAKQLGRNKVVSLD